MVLAFRQSYILLLRTFTGRYECGHVISLLLGVALSGNAESNGSSMFNHVRRCQPVWVHVFLIYSHLLPTENEKLHVDLASFFLL